MLKLLCPFSVVVSTYAETQIIKHTLLKKLLASTSIKREEIVKIRIPVLRVKAGIDGAVV